MNRSSMDAVRKLADFPSSSRLALSYEGDARSQMPHDHLGLRFGYMIFEPGFSCTSPDMMIASNVITVGVEHFEGISILGLDLYSTAWQNNEEEIFVDISDIGVEVVATSLIFAMFMLQMNVRTILPVAAISVANVNKRTSAKLLVGN